METPVEVRLDPALKATPQDLISQRDQALKLCGMVSSLNTSLKRMDGLKTQLQTLGKSSPDLAKATAEYGKELDSISAGLAVKIGGYRLEEAPQLAEDLTGLYGQLSAGNSAPTSAQSAYLAELERRHATGLAQANSLLDKAAKEWNENLTKLGATVLSTAAPR